MAALSAVIREALAGRVVQKCWVVTLAFASGDMHLWSGYGPLQSAGYVWSGIGDLGDISGIELPAANAPEATMTLSGVDPAMIAVALGEIHEWKGRLATVGVQHFTKDWQPLDPPLMLYAALMDNMKISADGATRKISVSLEWFMARRASPPHSELTNADQQARFAGDRFLETVVLMQNFQRKWPAR